MGPGKMGSYRFKLVIEAGLVKWCSIWLFLFLNLCYDLFLATIDMVRSGCAAADNRRMTEENLNHKEKKAKLEAKQRRRMREEYEKLTVTEQPKKQMKAGKSNTKNTIIMEEGNANISSASKHGKVDDECVESFMEQLKAKVKSEVDFSDFQILEEDLGKDLRMVGRFSVPLHLALIANRIKDGFGFTWEETQS
ncbi:uncharacterized protein [Gossypium hirsutum]|uniref:Uncharacterized protein n=1 Tax=Gossypium hirsutum TaxID=3635 RepID=A0ABM3AUZ7_GOSHI|nr:uncharacterized protein LOC107915815 [Gossypium hirsutum]